METSNLIVVDNTFIPVVDKPIAPQVEGGAVDFSSSLNSAIDRVNNLQVEADIEVSKLAHGNGNIHESAIAFEQADVTMRLAMKVRNKAIEAYQEVMRMPI